MAKCAGHCRVAPPRLSVVSSSRTLQGKTSQPARLEGQTSRRVAKRSLGVQCALAAPRTTSQGSNGSLIVGGPLRGKSPASTRSLCGSQAQPECAASNNIVLPDRWDGQSDLLGGDLMGREKERIGKTSVTFARRIDVERISLVNRCRWSPASTRRSFTRGTGLDNR